MRSISNDVLAVLSAGTCDGNKFFLPGATLDRKLYEATNKVLDALGGKWNRSAKAHVFADPCAEKIEDAIETGSYTDQRQELGWFPTPASLAKRVVDLAELKQGDWVLEPSAGMGSIATDAHGRGATVICMEIDGERASSLRGLGFGVRLCDFLQQPPEPMYDKVVMNPPFGRRADIHHVLHALKFLKPGGILVAIMSGGVAFREDKLALSIRNHPNLVSIENLPDGSFLPATGVSTVIVKFKV